MDSDWSSLQFCDLRRCFRRPIAFFNSSIFLARNFDKHVASVALFGLNKLITRTEGAVFALENQHLNPTNNPFLTGRLSVTQNEWLREPQRDAHQVVGEHFASCSEPVVLQIPVGCGKTGLMGILPFGIARGRVLIVAPNLTIRESIFDSIDSASRNCFWRQFDVAPASPCGPFAAKIDGPDTTLSDCEQSHFIVTNIQQLSASKGKWLNAFPSDFFDMVLIDEGHHNAAPSWQRVIKHFSTAKIVSLTATPFRADGKELTGTVVYRYPFLRAMQRGYIKRLEAVHVAPSELAFVFNDDAQRATLEEILKLREETWFSRGVALAPECNEHIVKASVEACEQLRSSDGMKHQIIAVACSVEHAAQVASLYRNSGYIAEEIHSKQTATQKKNVLQRLKRGTLDVIVQVQMLGEGFDHPPLSVAAVFRPFRSLSPYIQFVGRVMRVVRSQNACQNKGVIVSHVGLHIEQYWDDFRELDSSDQQLWAGLASGSSEAQVSTEEPSEEIKRFRPEMLVEWESIAETHESTYTPGLSSPDEVQLNGMNLKVEGPLYAGPQQQRRESRSRLKNIVNDAVRDLHFQLKADPVASNLSRRMRMMRHMNNWASVRYLIYWELNRSIGRKPKSGKAWSLDETEAAIDRLPEIKSRILEKLNHNAAIHSGSWRSSWSQNGKVDSNRKGWTRKAREA